SHLMPLSSSSMNTMSLLSGHPRFQYLYSFPTRRSSDLDMQILTNTLRIANQINDYIQNERSKKGKLDNYRYMYDPNHDRYFHVKDRKSTRLNSSHVSISYAVFCLKKKNKKTSRDNQYA